MPCGEARREDEHKMMQDDITGENLKWMYEENPNKSLHPLEWGRKVRKGGRRRGSSVEDVSGGETRRRRPRRTSRCRWRFEAGIRV